MRKWLIGLLRRFADRLDIPEGLEMRLVEFNEQYDIVSDETPEFPVAATLDGKGGEPGVEIGIDENRYLTISFRSLRRYMRTAKPA